MVNIMKTPLVPIALLRTWEEASQKSSAKVKCVITKNFYAFKSPVEDAFLNWVWCKNLDKTIVEKIDEFFLGKPHIYYLDESNPQLVIEASKNYLLPVDNFPQLIFDFTEKQPNQLSKYRLDFEIITSVNQLDLWSQTFCLGYDAYDYQYITSFFTPFFLCKSPPILVLGLENQKPICTAILFQNEDIACIMGISTLAEYRKKGYGSEISSFLLNIANQSESKKVVLNATNFALNMYKNLGFQEYINEKIFLPKKFCI